MSTTKQTMYARYCVLHDARGYALGQANLSDDLAAHIVSKLSGVEFFRLPYHERLRLAGLRIKLRKELSCSALRHHPVGVAIDLPKLDKDHFSEYRKGDVYLLGQDKQSYIVYPFEYGIVW